MSISEYIYHACLGADINAFYKILIRNDIMSAKYNVKSLEFGIWGYAHSYDESKDIPPMILSDEQINTVGLLDVDNKNDVRDFWQNVIIGTLASCNLQFAIFMYHFMNMPFGVLLTIMMYEDIASNRHDHIQKFYCELIKAIITKYDNVMVMHTMTDEFLTIIERCVHHKYIGNILIDHFLGRFTYIQLITIIGNFQRYDLVGQLDLVMDNVGYMPRQEYLPSEKDTIIDRNAVLRAICDIRVIDGFQFMVNHLKVSEMEYETLLDNHIDSIYITDSKIIDHLISTVTIHKIMTRDAIHIKNVLLCVCYYGLVHYIPKLLQGNHLSEADRLAVLSIAVDNKQIEVIKVLIPFMCNELLKPANTTRVVKLLYKLDCDVALVLYSNGITLDTALSMYKSAYLSDLGYNIINNEMYQLNERLNHHKKVITMIFKKSDCFVKYHFDDVVIYHILKFIGYVDIIRLIQNMKNMNEEYDY